MGTLDRLRGTGCEWKNLVILQPVAKFMYCGACRYTGYEDKSIRLMLACGHEQVRKASAGVPAKARCRDCEHLAAGGTITYGEPNE